MLRAPFAFVPDEIVLRHIFEQSVVGIFQSSLEGRNLLANPAFAFMLGYYSPEELRDAITDVARQFYVDPQRRSEISIQIARNGGHVEECESQVWRKDGSIIWISESTRVVCDPTSGQSIYLGSVADITLRKRSELALAESEARLRREVARRRAAEEALGSSLSQALVVCDEAGAIDFCSERAASLLRQHFGSAILLETLPDAFLPLLVDDQSPPERTLATPRGVLQVRNVHGVSGPKVRVFRLEEPFQHRLRQCALRRGLTGRESEVVYWVANAKTNAEIAQLLQVAEKTVKKHLERIYEKLGVENRTAASLRVNEWLEAREPGRSPDPDGAGKVGNR